MVGATRLVFIESERHLDVNLRATGENNYLVMGTLLSEGAKQTGDMKARVSAVNILPTALIIRGGEKRRLRMSLANKLSLPRDRESMMYLVVTALPEGEAEVNALQIAVRTWIKLFYRPASLDGKRIASLTVSAEGGDVVMRNASAFYVSLSDVRVGAREVTSPGDVPPFGEKRLSGCASAGECNVSWTQTGEDGLRVAHVSQITDS